MKFKTYKVHVTQEDIDKGGRQDCFCCPVAMAINRALGLGKGKRAYAGAWVYEKVWRIDTGERGERLRKLPRIARQFISTFDNLTGPSVSPFSFNIRMKDRT